MSASIFFQLLSGRYKLGCRINNELLSLFSPTGGGVPSGTFFIPKFQSKQPDYRIE